MDISAQYRFDTFAEGESSRLAFAAAKAVAEGNGSFNPLVLVSEPGLGKTHLLHSIANAFKAKNPSLKIICITALEFYEEYVRNIRQKAENMGQIDDMATKFRSADVLILDDLQNIKGKTESQHELLQIFNTLLLAEKPIIAASQVSIANIESLNESLRSRLTGGLSVTISLPAFVDRLAILRKKFDMILLNIEEHILQQLAEKTTGSVRDLEGIVSALRLRVLQSNRNIDIEMANEAVEEHFSHSSKIISIDNIVKAVALHYGISLDTLKQKSRGSKEAALARHVAMYLIKKMKNKTFEYTGKYFNRDGSSVMHACKKMEEKMQNEPLFSVEIKKIKRSLYE